MSVANVLSSIDAQDGDFIKNQTVSATYYTGVGWFGELTTIDPREMYKIYLGKAGALNFTGDPIDLITNATPIKNGWNWIGFLPQSSQVITEALSGIAPVADDFIKNPTKSGTFYDGVGWFGELVSLEPLDRYMLKTNHTANLIFPALIPTVTTADVTAITQTTAICGGNVTSEGGTSVTARGIFWVLC